LRHEKTKVERNRFFWRLLLPANVRWSRVQTFALTHINTPTVNFFTDSQEITIVSSRKKNLTEKRPRRRRRRRRRLVHWVKEHERGMKSSLWRLNEGNDSPGSPIVKRAATATAAHLCTQ
jgi:hypothetical protein